MPLRGHHLLCLLGYRGMGYSKEYVANMSALYQTLRSQPETKIQIVDGPDHLCAKFPCSGDYHCDHANVSQRDHVVLNRLGLQSGDVIEWQDILARIHTAMQPDDIATICATCQWRSYGICEEGVHLVMTGQSLPEL